MERIIQLYSLEKWVPPISVEYSTHRNVIFHLSSTSAGANYFCVVGNFEYHEADDVSFDRCKFGI